MKDNKKIKNFSTPRLNTMKNKASNSSLIVHRLLQKDLLLLLVFSQLRQELQLEANLTIAFGGISETRFVHNFGVFTG